MTTQASEPVIRVKDLTKRFGKVVAVDALTIAVPRGRVCGLVGPNGAGKTTIIRMLMGLLKPSAGEMEVLGLDPLKDGLALHARVGYVPEKHHIYEWMRVKQVLDFVGGVHPRWDPEECARLVDFLNLPLDRKVKALSRGELAKLALAVALAPQPGLLILDEPTSGLDPLVRRDFLSSIIRLIEGGDRTVLFSTHILSDVERVADRVIVLDRGQVVSHEDLEVLRRRYTKVSFLFPTPPEGDVPIPGARRVEKGLRERVAVFEAMDEGSVRALAARLGASDWLVQPMSFEDVFVEMLGKGEGKE